jgi:hypothetical protein
MKEKISNWLIKDGKSKMLDRICIISTTWLLFLLSLLWIIS